MNLGVLIAPDIPIYKLLSHYNPPTKTVLTVANIVHCIPFASINKTLNGTKSSSTSPHFY